MAGSFFGGLGSGIQVASFASCLRRLLRELLVYMGARI
jgi:hypothetical protein